jgi:hypothetical protein
MWMNDESRQYIQARAGTAIAALLPSVRPLAVPDPSGLEPIPAGSAVLLWHRGNRYVVTAAHVVELYRNSAYYMGPEGPWVELPMPFVVSVAKDATRKDDHFDFAFQRIDDTLADQLSGCVFLTANQIETHDNVQFGTPRAKYLALGWPLNRIEYKRYSNTTRLKNLSYIGGIASLQEYRTAKLVPKTNVVIDFDYQNVVGRSGLHTAPSVEGLSGGGMFRFRSVERLGDVSPPKLAAITIEQRRRERLMVGVRIDVVLAAIDRHFAR